MFKLVIATELENLPGFPTLNYVLVHVHRLLVCSLLRGDQNSERWSGFSQFSPVCRISCEIPLPRGTAQAVWSTSGCPKRIQFCVAKSRCISSLPCLAWVAPPRDVPLLVAPAVEMLVQGKLLGCPNGKYSHFLGPRLPLHLLCLHLSIVQVQQEPPGLTNSNRFECIDEVLCGEGKIMLLGF